MSSRVSMLAFVWLFLSGLLFVFALTLGRATIEDSVMQHVSQHLSLTVNKAHFNSADNAVNDVLGLRNVGEKINAALGGLVKTRWYSAQRSCVVRINQIDNVKIGEQSSPSRLFFNLPRNRIDREVGMAMDCSPNWLMPTAASLMLGLLFLLIHRFVPAPLSAQQREWMAYLVEQGYEDDEAFLAVSHCGDKELSLSSAQRSCFELLHDPLRRSFLPTLKIVSRSEVAALDKGQCHWFVLAMSRNLGFEEALKLANTPDSIAVDLQVMSLSLRGLEVPMGGTPLFYYAWYALQRMDGEGWVNNPASNRPDPEVGRQVAQLMSRHNGHGRAINDLEQAGLKARTLDQNRSKIKEDIVSVLGETLAENYLFETSKHPDGVHTRYRLGLESSAIDVLG